MALGKNKAAFDLLDTHDNPPTQSVRVRELMDLGQAAYRLSNIDRAETLLTAARDLAEVCTSPLLIAEVELRQSVLQVHRGAFDDAEFTLRHALGLASKAGDRYVQANITGNLGYLFQNRFRLDEAIYWFQQSLRLSKSIGAESLSAATVGNLGFCYYQLGDLEGALTNYEAAEASAARLGNSRQRGLWLGNAGNLSIDSGDYPLAINRLSKALIVAKELSDKPSTAMWLFNLARVSILKGDLAAAERYSDESQATNREIGDTGALLYDQLNVAEIAVAHKEFQRAADLLRSVLESASEDPSPALQAREDLASLYIETGEPDRAESQFQSAITGIEGRQADLPKEDYKISYLSNLVRFYRSYVDFLVQRGEIGKALEVAESSRARILTERASSNATTVVDASAVRFQTLARISHRVILSYWLAPQQSYLWAIAPANIRIFTLPAEKEIRSLVENYRTFIEDLRDPMESQNRAGAKLSEILLGPIRQLVSRGSHVVVIPDGALHSLNFATLPAPGDPARYWVEDVTLSVAPSLGLALNSRLDNKPRKAGLLAIGDPESPGQEFPRLPNARKEVDTIAALFSASDRAVYEGAASQPSVYSRADPARFGFIHFAAHATANRASPLDSALILSREGNAYALTAREIMKIPLNSAVVTLSSCRSAGARAYSGEGLVGLTWAFLNAGARDVVAGLWDVDDESTSQLMSNVYRELTRGVPPDDALRSAQLKLLGGNYPYKKPYYWGPFQLYSRIEKHRPE